MEDNTEEMDSETIRRKLIAVKIDGLFGNLTHNIPLNKEEGITILTGANGCGKTTIIKLIIAFLGFDLRVLLDVPYRELVFYFDDETEISVIRREASKMLMRRNPSDDERRRKIMNAGIRPVPPLIKPREKVFQSECELQFTLRTADGSKIEDPYATAVFDPDCDEKDYANAVSCETTLICPQWLRDYGESVTVNYISTDRIKYRVVSRKRLEQEPRIFEISEDGDEKENDLILPEELWIEIFSRWFINRVIDSRAIMTSKAQELTQSFPFRIIERIKIDSNVSTNELKSRFNHIVEKRQRLKNAGILVADSNEAFVVDEDMTGTTGMVLSIYAEDEEQKLAVFDGLLEKTELFLKIVNSRLVNKNLVLNSEDGFRIINSFDGECAPLFALSSGEQHEINLFYELIFLQAGTLVMIDEPELSLHVGWQLRFIDDLRKVRRLSGCQYLLATHSPAIIDDHWDFVVELEV